MSYLTLKPQYAKTMFKFWVKKKKPIVKKVFFLFLTF